MPQQHRSTCIVQPLARQYRRPHAAGAAVGRRLPESAVLRWWLTSQPAAKPTWQQAPNTLMSSMLQRTADRWAAH